MMPRQKKTKNNQQGVVLVIALVVLLVMMIAAVGLIRSVDSGNVAAANLALGQNNQLVADWGGERAFEWLNANKTLLDNDNAAAGYYAVRNGGAAVVNDTDWFASANWAGAMVYDATTVPAPPSGYVVRVLIQRMCSAQGSINAAGQLCSMGASTTSLASAGATVTIGGKSYAIGSSAGSGGSAGGGSNYIVPGNVYFRVTVRVEGPRNSLNVVQSMVTVSPT